MNDQTLWQLAQHFRDPNKGPLDPRQCAILVEAWARETAAQWIQNAQDYGQRNSRENEIAWAAVESHVADLGVPEEE